MSTNRTSTAAPFFPKHILLSEGHRQVLDTIKERRGLSHNAVIRLGIELVAKQFATERKNPGATLQG